jgi:hypothetical protein
MPIQFRRYELDPALVDEFLEFFAELTPLRATFGFRLLSAYLDRTKNEFIWVVEHDEAFVKAEATYSASPERTAFFAGRPAYAKALHISSPDTVKIV